MNVSRQYCENRMGFLGQTGRSASIHAEHCCVLTPRQREQFLFANFSLSLNYNSWIKVVFADLSEKNEVFTHSKGKE